MQHDYGWRASNCLRRDQNFRVENDFLRTSLYGHATKQDRATGEEMPSAKNGDFASLLDDLFQAASIPEEEDEEASAAAPSIPFDYLSVVDELHSGRIKVSDSEASAEYRAVGAQIEELLREFDLRRAEITPPPLEVEQWPSTEPADIAKELALETHKRADDLARARRAFAFDNHPDRVEPYLRDHAIVRMQIANMLIDDALRRLKR